MSNALPVQRRMKLLVGLLAVLLVASNAWWFYQAIDQGVTLMYRDQMLYEASNRVGALSVLADEAVRDKPKAEAEQLLRKLFPVRSLTKRKRL